MPPRPIGLHASESRRHLYLNDRIDIEIKDLGFGEIFMSSGKVWHYEMTM